MCANYLPTSPSDLSTAFGVELPGASWVAEAWPGMRAPIVLGGSGAAGGRALPSAGAADAPARHAVLAVFGLIPPWSRDGRDARHCYNARSETVAEKPSFRHAWRQRQWCVVPAQAFFEPRYDEGRAVRWRIAGVDDEPFAIAGIWESWRSPAGETVRSFSMLTINADGHPVMAAFHAPDDEKRSVVLLEDAQIDAWLGAGHAQARALLQPFAPQRVRCASDPRPPRATASRSPAG
jgi:putative SOS response-associated peptidase YedK